MNLYWVSVDYEYGYFVFAETANRAKSLCTKRNDDNEKYIYLRACLKSKNVEGPETVVDCEDDIDYQRVLDAGCRFMNEQEMDEFESKYN